MAQTKETLLRTGLETLIEKGFHNSGLRELLQSAGVPKGSFYHHFKNKEDFGRQVLEYYSQESIEHARTRLEDPDLTALERIRAFFRGGCRKARENGYRGGCLIGNLSQEMADTNPEFSRILARKWLGVEKLVAQNIQEAQHDGDIRNDMPANTLASFLINSWQGALTRGKLVKDPLPQQNFVEVVFQKLLV